MANNQGTAVLPSVNSNAPGAQAPPQVPQQRAQQAPQQGAQQVAPQGAQQNNQSAQPSKQRPPKANRRQWHGYWQSYFGHREDPTTISAEDRKFLTESNGSLPAIDHEHGPQARFYLDTLAAEAKAVPRNLCRIATGSDDPELASSTFQQVATLLATSLRADQFCTLDQLVENGVRDRHFLSSCKDPGDPRAAARQYTMIAMGRLTRFFEVKGSPAGQPLEVVQLNAGQHSSSPVTLRMGEKSQRPILEIFDLLENLLPIKGSEKTRHGFIDNDADPTSNQPSADALHVSCLNADILVKLIGVEICWTKCFTSHLDYDPIHSKLNVFALPSFLELQSSDESSLTMSLRSYYNGRHPPSKHDVRQFVQELIGTYKLLFRDEPRARKVWKTQERQRASIDGIRVDPMLDRICGGTKGSKTRRGRQSYDAHEHFPIYGERLRSLQDDILRQNSSRLSALWRDRRDGLRWYTFWTVLFVGLFGLTLGMVQCVLSGIQVAYAIKTYNQGPVVTG